MCSSTGWCRLTGPGTISMASAALSCRHSCTLLLFTLISSNVRYRMRRYASATAAESSPAAATPAVQCCSQVDRGNSNGVSSKCSQCLQVQPAQDTHGKRTCVKYNHTGQQLDSHDFGHQHRDQTQHLYLGSISPLLGMPASSSSSSRTSICSCAEGDSRPSSSGDSLAEAAEALLPPPADQQQHSSSSTAGAYTGLHMRYVSRFGL